jgi:hypothetical protein
MATDSHKEKDKEKEKEKEQDKNGGCKGDVLPTSPEAIAVSNLFNRRVSTAWAKKEVEAFKTLRARGSLTEESVAVIAIYYASERAKGGNGIHRRDLLTFLNNFDGELDRANAFKSNPKAHDRTTTNQRPDSNRNVGHNANLDYSKRSAEAQARFDRKLRETRELLHGLPNEGQPKPEAGA